MVESTTVMVETADRRTLEVLINGPDDGLPLLFHLGTPQGVAPFGILERPMGPENIEEFGAAIAGPRALEDWLNTHAPATFAVTAEDVIASFGQLFPEVDKAALTGELAESMAESLRRAGQQGIIGWRDDDLTLTRPWGFDLAAIEIPVSVWQGGQDKMVPYAHGVWLAEHIPGARAHLYQDEGHISLVMPVDRILDDLLARAGVAAS